MLFTKTLASQVTQNQMMNASGVNVGVSLACMKTFVLQHTPIKKK